MKLNILVESLNKCRSPSKNFKGDIKISRILYLKNFFDIILSFVDDS